MASGYGVPFAALGPLICVAYAVAFGVAAALLSRALPHQPRGSGDAKGVSSAFAPLQAPHMTARGRAVWLNTATSALHSAMSCVGVFVAVAALTAGPAPEGSSEAVIDLMGNDHAAPFLVLAASAGYFLFDTVDYVVKGLHVGRPDILVHHAVVLTCFLSALVTRRCVPYVGTTLLCEVNSVFLHARSLLRPFLKRGGAGALTAIGKLNTALLWISLVTTRLVPHVYLAFRVFADRGDFPHWSMYALAQVGMLAMNGLNVDLTVRLVRQDCARAQPPNAKKES